jgi:hypothetical protein
MIISPPAKYRRITFCALETIVLGSTLLLIWLAMYPGAISESLHWTVSIGVMVAPVFLLVTSVLLYPRQRHLFWIGVATIFILVIVLYLPIVPAVD